MTLKQGYLYTFSESVDTLPNYPQGFCFIVQHTIAICIRALSKSIVIVSLRDAVIRSVLKAHLSTPTRLRLMPIQQP
jgi:hypothetical protein